MDDNFVNIECPHCGQYIIVQKNEINCKIFRCGIFKQTGQQINPHETKDKCDMYYSNNLIYGCGKPFKLNDNLEVEICGYI